VHKVIEHDSSRDPLADPRAAAELAASALSLLDGATDPFDAWKQLARSLGGRHTRDEDGELSCFGFFAPQLDELGVGAGDVFVELLIPTEALDLAVAHQALRVRRVLLPALRAGQTWWAAARRCVAGTRTEVGVLYQLRFRDRSGNWGTCADPLAASLPFGPFGPAELYDTERLQRERRDGEWLRREVEAATLAEDGIPRLGPPCNILEVHVGTATLGGSVQSLDRRLRQLSERVREGLPLERDDECWLGYDAIQLMPLQAVVRDEAALPCWQEEAAGSVLAPVFDVEVRRPATTNWGYDVVISGAAAPNPSFLATRRPDEVVDLAETLHTFPGRPIRLMFDLVFGHADNQAIDLLPHQFFLGPNMYGQDLNYRHPPVRAILLELQRRLVDLGADGVRVDGAQDFKWWDAASDQLLHDDDFLCEMSAVTQRVAGVDYHPWIVFEDGRPWPRGDWELASSYQAVTATQPHAWQWGPLTFAHNTPFLHTFWISKWWRLTEVAATGEQWISGCANHDTVRRGTQVSPRLNINRRLGSTLLEIIDSAYDHAAANLLFYGLLPGTPMDFLNASMRASWGFMRNTDDRHAVKVVAEEASFLDWQVDDISYSKVGRFRRLKELGFEHRDQLRDFMRVLTAAVEVTEDLGAVVAIVRAAAERLPGGPDRPDVEGLTKIARAFMDDTHDYCNVSHYIAELDPARVAFNLALRRFRQQRPWLRRNLRPDESLSHRWPAHGTVLFHGTRRQPGGGEEVLAIANMEGTATTFVPADLPGVGDAPERWELALASPHLEAGRATEPLRLADAEGVLYTRST